MKIIIEHGKMEDVCSKSKEEWLGNIVAYDSGEPGIRRYFFVDSTDTRWDVSPELVDKILDMQKIVHPQFTIKDIINLGQTFSADEIISLAKEGLICGATLKWMSDLAKPFYPHLPPEAAHDSWVKENKKGGQK